MRKINLFLSLLILSTVAFNCGQKVDLNAASNFLPSSIAEHNIERVSDIRVFRGDSLWEYINGGAELYHDYNFVEVATADYKAGEVEFVTDIYRFDNSLNAYGLYTNFRPPVPDMINPGVEGYKAPASLNFVKGHYLVRLTGYDETAETDSALAALARAIEKELPGTNDYPEMFGKFYEDNKLEYTDKYLTESFMGRGYLSEFYTQDFLVEKDTITMFLSADTGGIKYDLWLEDLKSESSFKELPKGLLTADSRSFGYRDTYYGVIISCYDNGLLFGIRGARKEQRYILAKWVMAMPGIETEITVERFNELMDTLKF